MWCAKNIDVGTQCQHFLLPTPFFVIYYATDASHLLGSSLWFSSCVWSN